MTINDPRTGLAAGVEADGLIVTAKSSPRIFFIARDDPKVFSWGNLTYNYSAADTILCVKNISNFPLRIQRLCASGDTSTEVVVHREAVTTPTGTAVDGVNLNGLSSVQASTYTIAKANESTNAITAAGTIERFHVLGSVRVSVEFDGSLTIQPGYALCVDFVTDGGSGLVTIVGWIDE